MGARRSIAYPFALLLSAFALLFPRAGPCAEIWTVRVEEPTGLYPRTNEVDSILYERAYAHCPIRTRLAVL